MQNNKAPRLAEKDRCTGCTACEASCPKGAIQMLPDREGFLRPTVSDACIHCGNCTDACPALGQRQERNPPAVFAAWNEDDDVRMASGAGGVFALLADWVLQGGGVVFGAGVDEKLRVRHMEVRSHAALAPLLGVKPVQSDMGDAFLRVRDHLKQGRRVLFSGTPCQVDGLYRFLGEYPENLLTVDVLCRGVSSPRVWEKLVHSMAYIKRSRPVAVSFCGKLGSAQERRFRVTFANGTVYDAPYNRSELGRGHRRGLILRPACHTCPYASPNRPGDLTLGQFKGLPRDFHPQEQRKGVSLLLVNTAKGARALDVLELRKEPRTLDEAVAANPALSAPVAAPAERTSFFAAFARKPFLQVRNRFLAPLAYRIHRWEKGGLLKTIKDIGDTKLWK